MSIIEITGGKTLQGTVRPAAAKNSVLPLLAATLLCSAPCTLCGVPHLRDVETSMALLTRVGASVRRQGGDLHTAPVPDTALDGEIPAALAGAMRSSVFYLAPLLCRVGWVRLPLPGGCKLGPRPVDIHLAGLTAMGAKVEVDSMAVTLRRGGALHGADFTLRLPSVGATLTLLMAACCAQGTTVLRGAACEPEIVDMARFLRGCGARITGEGSPVLVVHGGTGLGGARYTPVPDRIAASTWAAALAAAGGTLTLTDCAPGNFASFLALLRRCGVQVQRRGGTVELVRDPARPLCGGQSVCANVWPAFATDAAPLAAAVLLCAQGPSEVYDHLFPERFACAEGFARMGAPCEVQRHRLRIPGGAQLHGAAVQVPDLRGGAALAVAALAARGTSMLHDPGQFIARGYEDLGGQLAALGAQCRVREEPPVD